LKPNTEKYLLTYVCIPGEIILKRVFECYGWYDSFKKGGGVTLCKRWVSNFMVLSEYGLIDRGISI
tara:strand:+ start:129 stop:326 length:198 start_codon:yes stop_codon:yes gene_type:complete